VACSFYLCENINTWFKPRIEEPTMNTEYDKTITMESIDEAVDAMDAVDITLDFKPGDDPAACIQDALASAYKDKNIELGDLLNFIFNSPDTENLHYVYTDILSLDGIPRWQQKS